MQDLSLLLPRNKHDIERAREIVRHGYPAVEPILDELMIWMQDLNWPVARVLAPFLARIGPPLAPYVRRVLGTSDVMWKYWVLTGIMAQSPELARLLRADVQQIASITPTDEDGASLVEAATEALRTAESGIVSD